MLFSGIRALFFCFKQPFVLGSLIFSDQPRVMAPFFPSYSRFFFSQVGFLLSFYGQRPTAPYGAYVLTIGYVYHLSFALRPVFLIFPTTIATYFAV